jgi:F0F1-type ATP synthase delta subunit
MMQELLDIGQQDLQLGLSEGELDDCASLLDRMEELEIFLEAPSIQAGEKQDALQELESVIEKVHYYSMKA